MTQVATESLTPALGRRTVLLALSAGAAATLAGGQAARAATAVALDADADAALKRLFATSPKARELAGRSRAMLIFPKITKAGFVIGGMGGDGVLRVGGRTAGYFRIAAGSVGFQAGVQSYGYVLFIITQSALDYLRSAKGWSIGTGPTLTVVDQGIAATLDTTTLSQDVYAMTFHERGLMAGINLEGSKISRITPD